MSVILSNIFKLLDTIRHFKIFADLALPVYNSYENIKFYFSGLNFALYLLKIIKIRNNTIF